MKNFFEKNKKFCFISAAIFLILIVFVLGGSPRIGFHAFENLNAIKGTPLKNSLPNNLIVTKVIDGDTVIVQGGSSVRLLGIDSDEKTYPCFEPAKLEMEKLVLGKEVRLEKDQEDTDQYKRFLRYIFVGDQNINLEMVKKGLAVARFYPENQKYKAEITAAESEAIVSKTGCKWSGE